MIFLYTDFGTEGPYVGQMKVAVLRTAPEIPVVDLMHDLPPFAIRAAARLLDPMTHSLGAGDVLVGVVDPGVGGSRLPVAVFAGGIWFVGPDNGLFEYVLRRHPEALAFEIAWRPDRLSASFHGRDLFAPVAARLARGDRRGLVPVVPQRFRDWPDVLAEIVYVDRYGNGITGMPADELVASAVIEVNAAALRSATTFSAVPAGEPFWYRNSLDLVEFAANGASAAARLGLRVGLPVTVRPPQVAASPSRA
ncbi:MAG: SAM-dependent chlorinase/fluorinase [Geminicoccaceae bacterium]